MSIGPAPCDNPECSVILDLDDNENFTIFRLNQCDQEEPVEEITLQPEQFCEAVDNDEIRVFCNPCATALTAEYLANRECLPCSWEEALGEEEE